VQHIVAARTARGHVVTRIAEQRKARGHAGGQPVMKSWLTKLKNNNKHELILHKSVVWTTGDRNNSSIHESRI
jgi:hypothetical protein